MDEAKPKQHIWYSKVVDLSHTIDTTSPQWPGDPPIEFEATSHIAKHGFYLRKLSMGEHSATHMNAPNSFHKTGIAIDAYSPESLIAPAVVIDIRDKTVNNPNYTLSLNDIQAWEHTHDLIAAHSVVILFTGWQNKWNNPLAYFNEDAYGDMHFPGFSIAATTFLLEERNIAGIGIDTHGVDPGQNKSFAINTLVLAEPRIVLENLTHLDQLPAKGTTLVLGILRLHNGSGSPLAVTALIP